MIIHLISSPRTVSTSLMYAFDNRPDTKGLDEPFYAYYLYKTGKVHPGRNEILRELPTKPDEVFDLIRAQAKHQQHLFIKNMAQHILAIDSENFKSYFNIFFIRDPKRVVASFSKVIDQPDMQDIAVADQWSLFQILQKIDAKCLIVDSTELLKSPEHVLKKICQELNIPFYETMLSWPMGAREIDGSWAKYWYESTHHATGFMPFRENAVTLNEHNAQLAAEASVYYNKLWEKSIHI